MSKQLSLPDQETLRHILDYNPETGALVWKVRPEWTFVVREGERFTRKRKMRIFNRRFPGQSAVCFHTLKARSDKPSNEGRITPVITINNSRHGAGRVIWKLVHNEEPEVVNVKDGDWTNLRLNNLQATAEIYKAKHHTVFGHNTSGYRGVSWHTKTNRWRAYIKVNQKNIHLGMYSTIERAVDARARAELRYGWKPQRPSPASNSTSTP